MGPLGSGPRFARCPLRPYLQGDASVASGVLHIFLRAIRATLHEASPGAPNSVQDVRLGAVSFLHRFGSSLNPHFHYHLVVLDGVFAENEEGVPAFHEATDLTPEHWQTLQRTVQVRVLRYFRRHGLLEDTTTADMLTWHGTGGFSIDASVRIEGDDRHGVERLVRYCARPPFALNRLHAMEGNDALSSPEARLLYRLPGPTPDGRTVLLLSPLELLQRLARLVPPPRMHRHRYHGVLAPNAGLRAQVVAIGRSEADDVVVSRTAEEDETVESPPSHVPEPSRSSGSSARGHPPKVGRWAQLLARIYQVLPLLCPSCGGDMRILAFLTDPPVVQGILLHLDLPHRPPPLTPARGPPQGDFLLDQTREFDLTEPDPIPEYEFDQSIPDDFDS
ncbi:MAG TPA: transposase [Longimicrobiales bacterium]|nr:transposase [Longimicrobiales bacterium]